MLEYPSTPNTPMTTKVDQIAFLKPLFKHAGDYTLFTTRVIFPDGTRVDIAGNYNTVTQRGELIMCDLYTK